jgi:hypothetical protein
MVAVICSTSKLRLTSPRYIFYQDIEREVVYHRLHRLQRFGVKSEVGKVIVF